jgi:hypothetical protein
VGGQRLESAQRDAIWRAGLGQVIGNPVPAPLHAFRPSALREGKGGYQRLPDWFDRELSWLVRPGAQPVLDHARAVGLPAGDPFAHPPLRAVALSATRPAGLKETARYLGTTPRYARLTYGSGRTAPVTFIVDEVGPGDVDLYIDGDHDNEVTARERVRGQKLTWRAELMANIHVGETVKQLPRTLQVLHNRISRTLAVGTCGYVEGKATLDGKAVSVRRTDGDANGLFADPQDRVWIDADGDGVWDPAGEELLFAPILRLGKERFAVWADALGQRLELAKLEGTGTLKLALPASIKPTAVREVAVTFQSKDGTIATVRQADGRVTVPTGDYRISSLLLTLDDPGGRAAWSYVFGDNGGKAPRWHVVGDAADCTAPGRRGQRLVNVRDIRTNNLMRHLICYLSLIKKCRFSRICRCYAVAS